MVNVRDATAVTIDTAAVSLVQMLSDGGKAAPDVFDNALIATAYHYALKEHVERFAAGMGGQAAAALGKGAAFALMIMMSKSSSGQMVRPMSTLLAGAAAAGTRFVDPMAEGFVSDLL